MRFLAVVLGALMLLSLGCGEDDEKKRSSQANGGAATEYRQEANALCRQGKKDVERLPAPTRAEDFGDYFDEAADLSEKYDKRAEALEPPPELRRQHEQLEREGKNGTRSLRRLATQFRKTDDPASTLKSELPALIRLVEKGNRLARRMGLKDCVEDLGDLQAQPDPSQS